MNACPAGNAVELTSSGANNAFLIQPIQMVSGVTLLVDAGVTVFGSRNPRDYDVTPGVCGTIDSSGQGCNALITGNSVVNAGIMGYGTIDGRGGDAMIGTSTTWWALANTANGQGLDQNNPRLIQMNSSNNFTLYKITLRNSPKFHVSYSLGKGFTVWGVKIITPTLARNTDGIDPASAQNITITNSYISDGDDMIAVKSSGGQQAQNITISNSHFGAGHGISIGSETNSGVSNMVVNNVSINMDATNTSQNGIRIKGDSSRGGLVTNVTYDGVCMQNATHPLVFNPYYSSSTGSLIPFYTNITLRNFHSLESGSMTFEGYSPSYPLGLTMDNVQIDGVKASNLTASYANITLGPGAVNFSPTGTGVNITNDIVNPAVIRDFSTAFPLAAGELFPTVGSTITGSTIPVTVQILPITAGAAAPSGTVLIMEGANVVASATVAGVLTSTQILSVPSGTHTYTAAYQGDGTYPAFTFGNYIATVGSPSLTSSTTLAASSSQIAYQALVTFTANVTATTGALTGNVTFVDTSNGNSHLATVAIDNTGTASFATSALASGTHVLTAIYAGDANHQGSTSNAATVTVSASTAVAVSVNTAVTQPVTAPRFGQSVTITASVVPQTITSAPTGTVIFTVDGIVQAASPVSGSSASITLTGLSTASHTVLAAYSGDSVYASGTAAPLTVVVNPETTSTTISASTSSTLRFQPVTLTAMVNSASAQANGVSLLGSVSFYTGGSLIGSAALNASNVAVYSTSTLPPGADSITASYSGTTNEAASASASTTVIVSSTVGTSPALPQLIPYSIATVAGTVGSASYGGDGGQATAASLNLPKGITADASGNLYIADTTNLVVRKVLAATGVITTFAGGGVGTCSGATDSYGDGCVATSAPLYGPRGTAADASGNIYIADYTKSEIRKVASATNQISLYAGTGSGGYSGDGAAANLGAIHNPENASIDASGNLYIADTKNNAIRQVTGGIITTIAGNGSAGYTGDGALATESTLNGPNAVVADASGNLYIADSGNFVVRRIDPSGNITTYAGTGVSGFNQTTGIASQTMLKNPTSVAVDAIGNVYITDSGNNLVFRVDALTQTITAVVGTSGAICSGGNTIGDGCPALQAKVSGTSAAAFDRSGNLYLADTNNDVIRKVSPNTQFALTAVGASLTQTVQVHFGPNDAPASTTPFVVSGGTGDFALSGSPSCTVNADSTQDCLLQIQFTPTAAGQRTASFAVTAQLGGSQNFPLVGISNLPGAADSISLLTTTPANGVLVYGAAAGFTATVTPQSGTQTPTGTVAFTVDGVTQAPIAMTAGAATYSTSTLTAGSHTLSAMYSGDSTFASVGTTSAITVSVGKASTSAVLTSSTASSVQAQSVTLTASVTASGSIAPTGSVTFLNGVNVLGSAQLNGSGVATFTTASLAVGSDSLTAVYAAGTNFSASTSPAVVVTITIAPLPQLIPYQLATVAGIPGTSSYIDNVAATSGTIKAPQGLAIDSSGNLYISDSGNLVIRKVSAATGLISTIAGAGTVCSGAAGVDSSQGDGCLATQALFSSPRGITLDPNADIFIADPGKNFIRRIDASTQIITSIAGTGSSGSQGDGGLSTAARVKSPQAIDSDSAGNLYMSDTSNNRVRIINTAGIISVIAGYPPQTSNTAGTAGFGGDGQLATSSTVLLNSPSGAAVDPSGNLYIADRLNNRIRKVNAGKIISTFAGTSTTTFTAAGGPAASTPLNSPYAVTSDALGNIYVSDYGNNAVWRVDVSTGYMYLVAGGGTGAGCANAYGDGCPGTQGKISHPFQLAFDPQGNLYISDSGDSAIRKLSLNTQFPATQTGATVTQTIEVHFAAGDTQASATPYVVSSGSANFAAGTAVCTLNTDNTTNCLVPITFAPTATGSLTGTLTVTSAGGYAQAFSLTGLAVPGGVATSTTLAAVSPASGVILYGQTATISATVAEISGTGVPTGKITFVIDGSSQSPISLSAGTASVVLSGLSVGQHFITASYNGDLSNQASATGAAGQLEVDVNPAPTSTTLAISANNVPISQSVTLTATISISTSGTPTGSVAFMDGSTTIGYGTLGVNNIATYTTSSLPAGSHNLTATYVGDSHFLTSTSSPLSLQVSAQNIWLVNPVGTLSELSNSGAAISSGAGFPGGTVGIAIDNAGNVWSAGASSLFETGLTGTSLGTFTGGGLNNPTALAVEGSGSVWITNGNNSLSVFTNSGRAISPPAGFTGANLNAPSSLAIDTSGNVWVANAGNSTVTEFLGAADPVVTPLAIGVKTNALGVKP